VQIRLLCVGALVGYARDQESGGDSRLYDSHRSVLELMLGADLPLRTGRFSLSPGAAIGQASLGTERRSGEHEQVPASYLALRGHVGAGIQLVGPWSLRADLALGSAPFAPGTVTEISFSQDPPSDTGEPPPLAGLPRWQGWFGFGLVYGGI